MTNGRQTRPLTLTGTLLKNFIGNQHELREESERWVWVGQSKGCRE